MNYPYNTANTTIKGAGKISYIDEGAGKQTILFIHGLANYALVWSKNIDYLRAHYRCIAIDLPGNGLSDGGDLPYSISFFADAISEFIRTLQLENVVLAGHSMGGQIALTTLLNHPDLTEQVVLCSPAGFETFSAFEIGLYKNSMNFFDLFTSEENSLKQIIQHSFYHRSNHAEKIANDLVQLMRLQPIKEYRKMVDACIHGMLHEPVFDKLHSIKQKALILFGENDELIPNKLLHHTTTKKIAEQGASRFTSAELHMISQCGHFVQWEKADKTNQLIHAFLK